MSNDIKRVQVGFTKEQYVLLQKFKGELGSSDSDVVRNIVLSWLTEKSFLTTQLKNKLFKENED